MQTLTAKNCQKRALPLICVILVNFKFHILALPLFTPVKFWRHCNPLLMAHSKLIVISRDCKPDLGHIGIFLF
jgi:hypothetical protein